MALLHHKPFQSPAWQFNGHIQTIIPSLFRKIEGLKARRERIITPDQDFLDLDWHQQDSKKLIILNHGLEGDSTRQYILGMVRAFKLAGWDALAWNYRGCSGVINKQLRYYHSGATDDLDVVVQHALAQNRYEEIVMVGFSLGGNLTLKYLGEQGSSIDSKISKSVVFSVPLDLSKGSDHISKPNNFIYSQRFKQTLIKKAYDKAQYFPDAFDLERLKKAKTLRDFDNIVTGPIHGFKDAQDYYAQCSSKYFINDIRIPTLVVNAYNDPFLPEACYPADRFKGLKNVHLEIPPNGGHCGFEMKNVKNNLFWSELRALEYVLEHKFELKNEHGVATEAID